MGANQSVPKEQSFYDSWKTATEILQTIDGAATFKHTKLNTLYSEGDADSKYKDSGRDVVIVDFYDESGQYMQTHHGLELASDDQPSKPWVYCHVNKMNPLDVICGSNVPATIIEPRKY
jgi:hypothetical protein